MRPRILIVDDQQIILNMLREVFARADFEVLSAQSAQEALECLDKEKVDVIVSDEVMPGMTGTEFLSIARKEYPETIRIILTGQASTQAAIKAINEGEIYRFFTKPFKPNELTAAISEALKQKKGVASQEAQTSLLDSMEKEHPGITRVKRDAGGVIILDED